MPNRKGIAEVAILLYVIAGLFLIFVPNPISTSVGLGVRPNKTVQTEKVELIKDAQGNPIALRTITHNDEIQQHVGFWEWLRSLPGLVIALMLLGIIFPPVSAFMWKIYNTLKADTKKIIVGVDDAMDRVKDDNLKKLMYLDMGNRQDASTKLLVDKTQGKK